MKVNHDLSRIGEPPLTEAEFNASFYEFAAYKWELSTVLNGYLVPTVDLESVKWSLFDAIKLANLLETNISTLVEEWRNFTAPAEPQE